MKRAREIFRQSFAASSARTSRSTIPTRSLAKDLRLLVRQQLQKGESNKQVIDYIVARYGEFVLLNPRLHWNTLLLWFAPIVLVLGGHSPGCPRRKASAARDRKRATPYARRAGRVGVGVLLKGRQARLEVAGPKSHFGTIYFFHGIVIGRTGPLAAKHAYVADRRKHLGPCHGQVSGFSLFHRRFHRRRPGSRFLGHRRKRCGASAEVPPRPHPFSAIGARIVPAFGTG